MCNVHHVTDNFDLNETNDNTIDENMTLNFKEIWRDTLDKNKDKNYEGNKMRFYRVLKNMKLILIL